jgi:hypothetical protein
MQVGQEAVGTLKLKQQPEQRHPHNSISPPSALPLPNHTQASTLNRWNNYRKKIKIDGTKQEAATSKVRISKTGQSRQVQSKSAAMAAVATSSHLLLLSRQAASLRCRLSFLGQPRRPGRVAPGQPQAPSANLRFMAAVDTVPASAETSKKKSSYEITTLTTWLLKQEQAGHIDGEMTIVLASISTACKQIASLVQRAPISNLTGVQGAVNVQGEDQKKLDVVSNEAMIKWINPIVDSIQRMAGPLILE